MSYDTIAKKNFVQYDINFDNARSCHDNQVKLRKSNFKLGTDASTYNINTGITHP